MKKNFIIIPVKFKILLLLALFLSALFAVPLQAQQGLLPEMQEVLQFYRQHEILVVYRSMVLLL